MYMIKTIYFFKKVKGLISTKFRTVIPSGREVGRGGAHQWAGIATTLALGLGGSFREFVLL